MNTFDTLVDAIRQCEIVDLSRDVTCHAGGPGASHKKCLDVTRHKSIQGRLTCLLLERPLS